MAVTVAQIKELREMTGAGMMDCKKALTESDGDIKKAVDWLREKGIAKAAKKEGRIAAEGLARILVDGNKAVIAEVNSETDFVAKNDKFLALIDKTLKALIKSDAKTVEDALALPTEDGTLNDSFVNAVSIIGEKLTLRRFAIVEKSDDEVFGSYMHQGGRISAITVVKGTDPQVAKNMAMQVASMNPTYVSRNDMPQDVVEHEREIIKAQMEADEKLASKPEKVKAGIIEGRLSKDLQEMCLVDQIFFLDQDKKCGQYLKENNSEVKSFVKYTVGEGIEKKQEDFAAEVASIAAGK
ncbi:MAG: translation elongation factor Ts [Solobacterium sp.]|jgi:elongation factor Ts|nr:translation elongation factor Ts [Solobacterium sp.]MCH4047873.1 translation elongation factor Ts [Solobacterium sp.]MCH4075541.1 translation elongation factor Ts [Solobacterium sp.]MCI1313263.1 translation elongation factor Ts [Solobacterium sp.]MCI1346033.1 translation elongation factor Ts [Solobacterium sp.]